jgi:hypothetical protein
MSNKPALSKKQIHDELWRRGILHWKLDAGQKQLYDLFYGTSHKVQTWLLARRSGKTYALCVLAIEQCIRKPNSIVKILSPTKLQVNTNLRPIFKTLLTDCPEEIKPEFRAKDYIYYFPNGSEIQLAGSDNGHAEKLRGGDSDIAMVDEAGSCDDLDNVVKSILLPTTLITKGKIILASTPPKEPDHEFIKFLEEAELRGSLVKRTFKENPRLTPEMIKELTDELGGETTEAYRREMLCEIIKDSSRAVVPEATDELLKDIVKEWPKPPFFDSYVSMDLGYTDMTVVVFGYYDFRAAKVIIEDELVMQGSEKDFSIKKLTEEIQKRENSLWTNVLTGEVKKPYQRVSDINHIVTNEILKNSNYQVNFQPAKKDDNDAAINNLRAMIGAKKVIINPRCVTLIRHLKNAKWKSANNKKEFARSPDDGHYDAVDALKYLLRHVVYSKNPYPVGYELNKTDLYVQNPEKFRSADPTAVYKKIFGRK